LSTSTVERFVLGKGRTFRPDESEEWERRYMELEVKLPAGISEADFWSAVSRAEALLDKWLEKAVGQPVAGLDPAALNSLPWRSYKTGEACTSPEEAGWIWADPSKHEPAKAETVKRLMEALEKVDKGGLRIGGCTYAYSGPKENKRMFISRRPIKQEAKQPL